MIAPILESEIDCDKDHKYTISGVKAPGVTSVLTQTRISDYPDTVTMLMARDRGSAVHKAIELYEKGTLDEASLTDQNQLAAFNISGYLDGYKRFRDEQIAKIIRYEMRVAHSIFRYCGTLDQVSVTLDGRVVVWDWKTGALPFWVELQTSAYLEALLTMMLDFFIEIDPKDIWHGAVQLCPDGSYKTPRLSQDRKAFSMFRQALNIVNYTDRRGK